MNIKVKDVVGDYCITWSDGDALYGLIRDSLNRNERVVLDFLGIKLFASPFFNFSIGKLFNDFSKEYILENHS
ncbi:MAG: STAS-like domain-containing protein [Planctomycetia bacterium]|nr:STAS-like domain-containing protein [Planctomycetia bacterium]